MLSSAEEDFYSLASFSMVKCGPHTYKRHFFEKEFERKTPSLLHKVTKLRKYLAVIMRSSSNNITRLTENNSHLTINFWLYFGSRPDNECIHKLMVDHQRRFFSAFKSNSFTAQAKLDDLCKFSSEFCWMLFSLCIQTVDKVTVIIAVA